MGPHLVVVVLTAPASHQGLCLGECVEDLSLQQLVSELAVEALHLAVVPERAGLDEQLFDADPTESLPHRFGDELRLVVRAEVICNTSGHEQLGKSLQEIL